MTTKRHQDGIVAWVTSLESGQPLGGVEIVVLSESNQSLARAKTDGDGLARLVLPERHPDGRPWAVVARLGEDRSIRALERATWMFDDVDLGGRSLPRNHDVFLYSERGVYRPGDVAHLTGVIRDAKGATPDPFPLEVKVFRPDGKKVDTMITTPKPGEEGVFHLDYKTWENGRTGRYRFQVGLPGANERLGSASILVEAFVPARIEVKAQPVRGRFSREEFPNVDVSARYLFDQPAAGLGVALSGSLEKLRFRSSRFSGHVFGEKAGAFRRPLRSAAGMLDEDGKTRIKAADVLPPGGGGLWKGDLRITVTESGGRSVSTPTTLEWDTAGRHVGLRIGNENMVTPGAPHSVAMVVVDGDDRPVAGRVGLELVRLVRDWSLQDVDGRLIWRRVDEPYPVKEWTVDAGLDGSSFEINCSDAGEYRLSATDIESGSITRIDLIASDAAGPVGAGSPNRLELALDKARYAPGSEAILRVRSPIAGKGLVTVETDDVLHLEALEIKEGETIVKLPVASSIRGSAFVTATVVRPVDTESGVWKVFRAKGIARLEIDHSEQRLEPEIRVDQRARPGETARVTVAIPNWGPARSGVVHLWAVDEGILQTTGFTTPNPFDHFFAKRGQAVLSGDSYSGLLPDFHRPSDMERIGAGGGRAERMRLSPVKGNRKPPAVIWRSVESIAADGTVVVDLNLPDMTGELRLMAVAAAGDCYGATHTELTVTSPFLIEPSLPRFAAPGDRFSIPVKVFNTTDRDARLALNVLIDGPVDVRNSGPGLMSIRAGRSETVWLDARAEGLGPVEMQFTARAEEEVSDARATMGVRPAAPLGFESRRFAVEAGQTLTIEPPAKFLATGTRGVVSIGASPLTDLRPAIERLIGYPHGCIEQTSSRLFTMLHAPSLLPDSQAEMVRHILAAGVDRIAMMQTAAGGFGYWPGDTRPYLWGTLYATEFLLEARRQGIAVEREMLDEALVYLQKELYERTPGPNLQARICHLLALMDKPEPGRMAALGESLGELDRAGRAALAGGWLAAGRVELARKALRDGTLDLPAPRTFSGRLTSPVAQDAALLRTLLEIDPGHEWIPGLARRIDGARAKGFWSSTLDNAMALGALTKYQAMQSGESAEFTGSIESGVNGEAQFSHADALTREFEWGEAPLRIKSKGKGRMFVSVTTEGLLRQPEVKAHDRELKVRRQWTTEAGEVIWGERLSSDEAAQETGDRMGAPGLAEPVKLKVGELIYVDVTICSPERRIDNIAIVDALPGGVEIENPRLAASATRVGRGSLPSRVEFLDDRAVLFVSAGRAIQTYRYALRVVASGEFALPPIQASCMYDVELASLSGAGRLEALR